MKKFWEFIKKLKSWIAVDGLLHICFSILILIFFMSFIPLFCATMTTLIIVLSKEIYDIYIKKSNNLSQSFHDILCDLIGMLIAICIYYPIITFVLK